MHKPRKAFNCWFHYQFGSSPTEANGSARVLDVLPMLWCTFASGLNDLLPWEKPVFPLLSKYVLHASTSQKSSGSDHPEFSKYLLNCHLFTVGELFSWWTKASQSRYLTALVHFNSFCGFLLYDLIQNISKQTFSKRNSKVWLHHL